MTSNAWNGVWKVIMLKASIVFRKASEGFS
jgi:hypothetical protein